MHHVFGRGREHGGQNAAVCVWKFIGNGIWVELTVGGEFDRLAKESVNTASFAFGRFTCVNTLRRHERVRHTTAVEMLTRVPCLRQFVHVLARCRQCLDSRTGIVAGGSRCASCFVGL